MNKRIDLLLVNSFAPRNRIASDTALENSLALLRTYLEKKGFAVAVIDEQRVGAIEKGVPRWVNRLLRRLVEWQIKVYARQKKLLLLPLMLAAWPVQAAGLYFRRRYMEELADTIVKLVKEGNIPVVGIKSWYGDSYKWSAMLAAKVRQAAPETVVVVGGPQVNVYGEYVTRNRHFDLAIMGPGEQMLEKLLRLRWTAANKEEFLRLVRHNISPAPLIRVGQYSGKSVPTATFNSIPRYTPAELTDKMLFHTLVDGVGCTWNKCNFCSHTRQQIPYTPRPVEQIKGEIVTMIQQGIAFFRFSSSETPVYQGKAIAQMLLANNINIRYSMFVRAGKVTDQTYQAYCQMIRAGLRAVFMGGETGHDAVNAAIMNKGVTRQDIIDTIHCLKLAAAEAGAPCRIGLALIYPCPVPPGVSLESVFEANLRLIEDTLPDTVIVNPPGIFPGTIWFEQADSFGFKAGAGFTPELMEYEYSIHKPAEFWPKLDYMLNGQDVPRLLRENGRLRQAIQAMGIPIGVSDELLMMTEAIGYRSKLDLLQFQKNSLIDIMSGSSQYLRTVVDQINASSQALAATNSPHFAADFPVPRKNAI
ncbi:MAG TPA: cobalamin-dependent protein [Methylomusa anaerophila]|uniref:B12 binding domain protein n=1 Tax=Methylomusa anaerophila TaxID=1930071 RepID=A0A348AG92_9FIRM|nr:cobalamin-dependent protein [Methylomusa anaerophila]BBB90090.1 B12 binding domain protein [Methylomusa anaerophila]HML88185.1 cobalamin-dependent protein [Methylomusa anaerophila]